MSECRYLGRGKTLGRGMSFCQVVYRLKKGLISATGLVPAGTLVVVLIVNGGSGYYAGVGGVVTIQTVSVQPRRSHLFFQLIGPD